MDEITRSMRYVVEETSVILAGKDKKQMHQIKKMWIKFGKKLDIINKECEEILKNNKYQFNIN